MANQTDETAPADSTAPAAPETAAPAAHNNNNNNNNNNNTAAATTSTKDHAEQQQPQQYSTKAEEDVEMDDAEQGVVGGHENILTRIKTHFGDRPECFQNTFQETSFVFIATMSMASTSFLSGALTIVTASIGRDLGMTQGEISWITASTTLVAGAFQLALGQLADLLGRKPMLIIGFGAFSACVLLIAFSQNPFWMVIGCGLVGLPSAMVVPPSIGILGAAYHTPSKRKNTAFSAFSAGNPLGFIAGIIVCGIASSITSWRAAFVFIAIVWAVLTAFAVWAVPNVENFDRAPLKERLGGLKHFDYVATILTVFGTGMFTAGLTLGPSDGWASATVLVLLILGVALLVIFVFWERVFPTPLMPPHIWKDRNFTLIIICVLMGMMSFVAAIFWLSFWMQEVQKLSTLTIAAHLLPMAIAGILWNVVASRILHSVNNTLILAFGSLGYLGGSLLLYFMKPDSNFWGFLFVSQILNVAGADLQFNVANMYVMQSLPKHQQSLAGGIFNVVIRLSSTIVMGITTAVFSSVALTPEGIADPLLSYRRTFLVCVVLSAAGLLIVPFIRLGTQGNAPKEVAVESDRSTSGADSVVNTTPAAAAASSTTTTVAAEEGGKEKEKS